MYFPYLRGRQYELLALKDLASKKLISDKVIPIVEPIKTTSTLSNTLTIFEKLGLPICLVTNPSVGYLSSNDILKYLPKKSPSAITPALLINSTINDEEGLLDKTRIDLKQAISVICEEEQLRYHQKIFLNTEPKFTLCPGSRKDRKFIANNRVLFQDHFKKQQRNVDYIDDEPFSEDHLDYLEYGYCGFGDYSIIGSQYSEKGFAPYAVAIHIVYIKEDQSFGIKHFTSDSNDDISNVAGKFYEAVLKLERWYSSENLTPKTEGLRQLLEHYENGTYPGLPTLKKLSIMHHFELVNRYLLDK